MNEDDYAYFDGCTCDACCLVREQRKEAAAAAAFVSPEYTDFKAIDPAEHAEIDPLLDLLRQCRQQLEDCVCGVGNSELIEAITALLG